MATQVERTELLVWGYIRNIQKMYRHLNIPFEINDIIYLYQRVCDEWCQKYKSIDISIDTDKSMVTANTDCSVTMYGQQVVNEGVFKWGVKIISFTREGHSGYPFVGIVKNNEEDLEEFLNDTDFDLFGYQYCGGTGNFYNKNDQLGTADFTWNQNGDILEITLDLNKQSLSVRMNDGDLVQFSDIDPSPNGYRLALGVYLCKGSQFQLL